MMRSLLFAVVLVLNGGCEQMQTEIDVAITVKTNMGDTVAGAAVMFDGQKIGETNNYGKFEAKVERPVGTQTRVEIKKESDLYYFAPYFESFVVGDKSPQSLNFTATLYFVPKPTPQVAEEQPKQADLPVHTADKPLVEEAVVADTPKPSVTKDETTEKETAIAPAENLTAEAEEEPQPEKPVIEEMASEEEPKLALTPVSQEDGGKVYPKKERENEGKTLFTVHVYSGGKPLGQAEIYVGRESKGDLKVACTTNPRGRCVIRFKDKPRSTVAFVAKKRGFKTKSMITRVADQGQLRFTLERGRTVDIFAITKAYNYTRGLAKVAVLIDGRTVGVTDQFGYFSYVHTGKKDDLISVALKPMGFLPEVYETDFVASGALTLVKYFYPKAPPAVRMVLIPLQPAGKVSKNNLKAFDGSVDQHLGKAARKSIFSSTSFAEVQSTTFNRAAKRAGKTLTDLKRQGWQNTPLKAKIDALLVPTLVTNARPYLQLAVIDSKGRVLAAAKEKLDSIYDTASIERAVAVLAKKITRAFPFEGVVLSKKADKLDLNLGISSGRAIKPGDLLDVYGMQSDRSGRSQTQKKIAEVTVLEVHDGASTAKVSRLEPRSIIGRGDLVVLRPRSAPKVTAVQFRVAGNVAGVSDSAVAQASIYFNDHWVGSTDEKGRLYADIKGSGSLKVIKHGYEQYRKDVTISTGKSVNVRLKRESAFIRIATTPLSAEVIIDGRSLGKTPISTPVPVPAGFVKLELKAPAGYKDYTTVLELDQGTLDLTGANEVQLERDLISAGRQLLSAGKAAQAVERLQAIPPTHSDYLLAQHLAGETLLTRMKKPADAATAFSKVTSNPGVKQFSDKRFIGSHINEGIALFLAAEAIEGEPQVALAHYRKAIDVLNGVSPQLRFVPKDQYEQAVHNVQYHKALSRHRMWKYTKDPGALNRSVREWKSYLDTSVGQKIEDESIKNYLESAKVYYKQAQAQTAIR